MKGGSHFCRNRLERKKDGKWEGQWSSMQQFRREMIAVLDELSAVEETGKDRHWREYTEHHARV